MKPKNFNRKLRLNRTTVVNLSNPGMGKIYGGGTHLHQTCTCNTVCPETCWDTCKTAPESCTCPLTIPCQ